VQSNSWFAGIGVGIDYYGFHRSVPLFVDVKKIFPKRQIQRFYLQMPGIISPGQLINNGLTPVDYIMRRELDISLV